MYSFAISPSSWLNPNVVHTIRKRVIQNRPLLNTTFGAPKLIKFNPLNPVVHFWLHHTANCTQFCVSRKGGTGGGRWGVMHMVAARLGCQSAIFGTGWANSRPGCMDRPRRRYSHLVWGLFLAGKDAWALSGCLTTARVLTIACSLMSGRD